MSGFIFRISLKQYEGTEEEVQLQAKADWVAFAAMPGVENTWGVFEVGAADGRHAHGYVKTKKTRNTVVSYLKRCFTVVDGPSGHSLKVVNPAKLPEYVVYCAKGVHGCRGSPVVVLYEAEPHLWDVLHDTFHKKAAEIEDRKSGGRKGMEAWYEEMAEKLKSQGKTSKEDVLEAVTAFYVHESKKGFEKFAVTRTFWRVYSLVSGSDAQSLIYQSVAESVFRV